MARIRSTAEVGLSAEALADLAVSIIIIAIFLPFSAGQVVTTVVLGLVLGIAAGFVMVRVDWETQRCDDSR